MTDVRGGFLVVEGCYHCGARSSFFSTEPVPPRDEYREGEHIWEYLSGDQAVSFGLRCDLCGQTRPERHDRPHDVAVRGPRLPGRTPGGTAGDRASVYVALCGDSTHESGHCVSDEGVAALEAYFNQGRRPARGASSSCRAACATTPTAAAGSCISDAGLIDL